MTTVKRHRHGPVAQQVFQADEATMVIRQKERRHLVARPR